MSRTTMTAALAVILAAATPMAYGQTTTTTTTPPIVTTTVHTGVPANHIMAGQIRLTQMNGATIHDTQNRNIGDIKDIILDRDGRVAAVVLDVGSFLGMGGKYVAIRMNDLEVTFDNNKPHFAVDMTKEQLKAAQAYDLNEKDATTGTSTPPADR